MKKILMFTILNIVALVNAEGLKDWREGAFIAGATCLMPYYALKWSFEGSKALLEGPKMINKKYDEEIKLKKINKFALGFSRAKVIQSPNFDPIDKQLSFSSHNELLQRTEKNIEQLTKEKEFNANYHYSYNIAKVMSALGVIAAWAYVVGSYFITNNPISQ